MPRKKMKPGKIYKQIHQNGVETVLVKLEHRSLKTTFFNKTLFPQQPRGNLRDLILSQDSTYLYYICKQTATKAV
jgi:hypothetical protein